ncbi:hypothetical protein LB503_012310 [Fusarium chuoi]|nr:hypothetical protein LB503_012310 [Fusarium chuoi]
MRPLQESLSRWRETQSQGAHLGNLRRAVRYNGPASPCISGCRSLCWKTFLLSTAAEGLSWSQVLDDERKLYAEKRDHFLKYIKHPEALAELNIDPLTEDPSVRPTKLERNHLTDFLHGIRFVKMRLSVLRSSKTFSDSPMKLHTMKTRPSQ